MPDLSTFTLASTIAAILGIAIGVMFPAIAMGRAISQALDALARQPEAERSIMRTLFIGLAMIESLTIYCFVIAMILIFFNPFWNKVISLAGG